MNVFDALNDTTDKATNIGERYIKASHQYLKLKIFQQLTLTMSLLAKVLIIGGMMFVGLVFSSVALAMEIGDALNSLALGYLVVGSIYVALAILLYFVRTKINNLIIKKTGQNFFT